jgi:hypothetical protein
MVIACANCPLTVKILTEDLYALSKGSDEARKAYEEVKRLAESGNMDPGTGRWMHIHLWEEDQAFVRIEKACIERSTGKQHSLNPLKVSFRNSPNPSSCLFLFLKTERPATARLN